MGVRVVEQGGTNTHLGNTVFDADSAQGEAGVQVTVEPNESDRAPVPSARRLLMILDKLHRPRLRGAGDGDGPGVCQEGVEGVKLFTEVALDVIDRVDEPGVHLNLAAPDHAHAAGLADTGLVIAINVGTHSEFRLVLARVEQPQNLGSIADRIPATGDGARDGAGLDAITVNADVHLRRGTDQVLGLAQVDEESVRGRVALAQAAEQLGRWRRARLKESLARDHLEQVTPLKRLARATHARGVLTGRVIARALDTVGAEVSLRRTLTWQTVG